MPPSLFGDLFSGGGLPSLGDVAKRRRSSIFYEPPALDSEPPTPPEDDSYIGRASRLYDRASEFIGGPKQAIDLATGLGADYLKRRGIDLGIDTERGNEAGQLLRKIPGPLSWGETYANAVTSRLPGEFGNVVRGAQEGLLEKSSALATDPMMALVPESKLAAAAFLPGIAKGAGEELGQAGAALESGNYREAARHGAGGLVDTGFALLGGLHAGRRGVPGIEEASARMAPPAEATAPTLRRPDFAEGATVQPEGPPAPDLGYGRGGVPVNQPPSGQRGVDLTIEEAARLTQSVAQQQAQARAASAAAQAALQQPAAPPAAAPPVEAPPAPAPEPTLSARDADEVGRLARMLPQLPEADLSKRLEFYQRKGLTGSADAVRAEIQNRQPPSLAAEPVPVAPEPTAPVTPGGPIEAQAIPEAVQPEPLPGRQQGETQPTFQAQPQPPVVPVEASPVVPERRVDTGFRKRVADMTPEEKHQALFTDYRTGLANDRAFEEDASHPDLGGGVASMDMSGLKWFNDTHGHPAGDEVIAAVVKALSEEQGVKAYTVGKGDEFYLRGQSPEHVEAAGRAIQERLANSIVEATRPDGTKVRWRGLRLDYGTGKERSSADAALYQRRVEAVARGERLDTSKAENRGQRPLGLVDVPAEGDHVQGAAPAEAPPELAGPTPTFREWLGDRRVPNDPNYVRGLREQYLAAYPDADRTQFQAGGGPVSAAVEEPPPERVDVGGLKARAAEEARQLVPDSDVERDLRENVAPALARGVDRGQRRAGINSIKPELGIEDVQGDPKALVTAIKRDEDNPKYLELKEARRGAMADERASFTPPEEPQGEQPQYSVARKPAGELPDGYRVEEGRFELTRGKVRVIDPEGNASNWHLTVSEALAESERNATSRAGARDASARYQAALERAKAGQATDTDVLHLAGGRKSITGRYAQGLLRDMGIRGKAGEAIVRKTPSRVIASGDYVMDPREVVNRGAAYLAEQPGQPDLKYSVRPAPGQRGLEGIAEDVAQPKERKAKPEQTAMFGGEMLQPSAARTTEGREAEGALFTQDAEARARKEKEAQGGLFAQEESASPPPKASEPEAPRGISDFGEKIGGARKDTSRPLGPRAPKPETAEPEGPAWRRQYRVFQDARDVTRLGEEKAPWRIAKGDSIVYRSGRETTFPTRAEAEAALPLMEVSRNHRVYRLRGGDESYGIYRDITDRKRALVRGGFESDEAAKRYMAQNPEEIIGHKFPMPDKPWLDHIERKGPEYRQGDVQPAKFQETFGFRGGEFGNWNMGSDGQAALNHAYDGLMDLSRTLKVPPKALSLNGELAIAFGARGHGGKDSARAHYEPDKAVINLTKIKGAGSLAHEWFHALDHYLSTQAGARSKLDTLSRGFPYQNKTRPELKDAFQRVMKEVTSSERTEAVNGDQATKFADRMAEGVTRVLDGIRNAFTYEPYNKRMRKPTAEELSKFDAIAERIKAGEVGPRKTVDGKGMMAFRHSYEPIEELNDLYKSVRGRSFATADPGSSGRQLAAQVDSMLVARERVERAKGGASETKRGPSDFLRNARDIDQYRASDYWSTPHEMAARAFEAYAHDKLAKATERSDYLAHGVENKYYALLDMKPYPEGTERGKLNAAFDNLFETLKTKETEKGTALYKAGERGAAPSEGSLTLRDVRQHIRAPGITETPEGFQFRVGQTSVRIDRVGDIHLDPKAFASGRPGQSPEGMQAVGSYQRVGDLATIKLLAKEGETPRVLLHESWHLIRDLNLLSEGEQRAIEKRYGKSEEAQADAYAEWNPKERPNGVFQKIQSFFRNIYRAFKPSWESAFEKVRSGRAFANGEVLPVESRGMSDRSVTTGDRVAETPASFATAPKQPPQVRPIPPGATPGPKAVQPQATAPPSAKAQSAFSIPEETALQKFQRVIQDKLNRVGTYERAVKEQGGQIRHEDLQASLQSLTSVAGEKITDAQRRIVDPLAKTLAEEGLTLKQLDQYVYAKHAPGANAHLATLDKNGRADLSGMSDSDAAKILQDFNQKGLTPKLQKAERFVREARDESLQVMVDGGLLSKTQAAAWKASMPDYVPLRTFDPIGENAGTGTGQGFDIRGKEAKQRLGRTTEADSPTAFMMHQLERAIVRAEKNKRDQKFADFVKDNKLFEMDKEHKRREVGPDGKVREVRDVLRDRDDFTYKVDGETHRIDILSEDPILDRTMKNVSAKEMNKFVEHAAKFTRFYSQLVTSWNPEFLATNFARDVQTAGANLSAEHGGKIAAQAMKSIPSAMKAMYQSLRDPKATGPWVTLAKEFREDGGSVGWYSLQNPADLAKTVESKVKLEGPGVMPAIKRVLGGSKGWIEDANKSVESGTRLAAYKALRDAGVAREKAGNIARNLTIDFTKKGEAGPTINALYAFFNANVQGAARLKSVVIDNPKGRAIAAGLAGLGFALDQYNHSQAGDSNGDGTNDYDDIPEYVKERNLVMMRGKGEKPLLVPLPYGLNVILTAGRQASQVSLGSVKPGRAALNVSASLWSAFNPLGSEADVVQFLTPTALDPVVQHATNRDFTGKPIMPEQFPTEPKKPPSELYFRNVPPLAREIAKFLNEKTGGDKVTPGYISVSPEILQHYYDFASGGVGRFVSNAVATGTSVAKGEAPELRTAPFARRFLYEERPGATSQKYRANLQELDTLYNRYKTYRQEGDFEKANSLPMDLLRAKRAVDGIDTVVRALHKKAKAGIDVDKRLEALQARANRIMATARRNAGLPPGGD